MLALRPRRFWFLLNQISRLRAEEYLGLFEVQIGAQAEGEGREMIANGLREQIGKVFVWTPTLPAVIELEDDGLDPEFDREGLRALRAKYS